jgi:hypothetical protein
MQGAVLRAKLQRPMRKPLIRNPPWWLLIALAALKESAQGQLGPNVLVPDDPAGTRVTRLTNAGPFFATRKPGRAFYRCDGE